MIEDRKSFDNAADEEGMQPLLLATKSSNFDLVKLLLETGADISSCFDLAGRTVLHHLCSNSNSAEQLKLLQLLFDSNETVFHDMSKTFDNNGYTPLFSSIISQEFTVY